MYVAVSQNCFRPTNDEKKMLNIFKLVSLKLAYHTND